MLDKENILNRTNNGLDFFKFVIPELTENGNKCKNVKNPFYQDTNASLSIYKHKGVWCFKDHGNDTYKGDIFTFAGFYYNLNPSTDFHQILENINNNLHLNLTNTSSMQENSKIEKQLFHIKNTNKKQAEEYLKSRRITKAKNFYQANKWEGEQADAIVFINHNQTGYEKRFIATPEELKKLSLSKTKFSGTKQNTLYLGAYDPTKDEVFFVEGVINALSLAEKGFSAIATFGTGNLPSPELLKKFSQNKIVYLAGDGDEAGEKFNNNLCKLIIENNIPVKEIYNIYFPDGIDANDLLIDNKEIINKAYLHSVDITKKREEYTKQIISEPTTQPASQEPNNETEDKIFNTPTLPNEIYKNLPEILKSSTDLFKEDIEKDVLLIGAISVLSACLPNIQGIYFDEPYTPHLYAFITASAASGKGKLKWAKYFGEKIHNTFTEQSKKEKANYQIEIEEYNSLDKIEKVEREKPQEPQQKMFYIPANSSASAFIKALADNNFKGIIFETEADTLAQTLKQDWGSFSDIMRKAFHHENTSLLRRKGSEFIEIKDPHLAIVLSGTPEQVNNLMPSVENGLFSRFLFYAFEDETEFNNPFVSHKKINYIDFFNQKGNEIFGLYNMLANNKEPMNFKLTEQQGNNFQKTFNQMLNKNQTLVGRDFNANIKRLGLITFRIAMILSALRILETGDITNPIICSDTDYNTALLIAQNLEKHAIEVYRKLPNNNLKGKKQDFYNTLPQQFNRQEYLKIADKLEIKTKAAEKYINQFKTKKILNHEFNNYSKI